MSAPGRFDAAVSTPRLLRDRPRSAFLVVCVALAYLGAAIVWGVSIARDGAPDEPEHMAMTRFFADEGRIPVLGVDLSAHLMDEETRAIFELPAPDPATGRVEFRPPAGRQFDLRPHYAAMPGLSYWAAGLVVRAGRALGVRDDYASARAASALFGALTVLVAGLVAIRLRPERPEIHLLAPATVAFLPQFLFVGAYANCDVFAALTGALAAWRLLVGARRGWPLRDAALFGVALGLGLLSKLTAYPALAVLAAAMALSLRGAWSARAVRAAVAAGVALAVASPWFVHNWRAYGEITGQRATLECTQRALALLPDDVQPLIRTFDGRRSGEAMGFTYGSLLFGGWSIGVVTSFVGCFGWLTKMLRPWMYVAYGALGAAAFAGVVLAAMRGPRLRERVADLGFLAACAAALAATFVAVLVHSQVTDVQAQGRYLFPAIAGGAALFALGTTELATSPRARMLVALAASAAMAALSAAAFRWVLIW